MAKTPPPPENPLDPKPYRRPGWLSGLRSSFFTGLVVVGPVAVTIWLIWTVVGWVDGVVMPFVPGAYHPETLINKYFNCADCEPIRVNIRGVGVVVFLLFTVLVGWMAKGFLGRSFLRWAESLVDRMPVVRSIYNGLKQIAETVFAQTETNFDKACLVQYPRHGIWAIAFISTKAKGEIAKKSPVEDEMVSVFLPTTPNPTSGFLLFVPRKDVIILDMTVEDAAKLVISAGLVYPSDKIPAALPEAAQAVEEREKGAA
ncbi:DUF502 domain-containing protein [Vannielia litorea]|uniref:DUF502 domain-containing protein n=1 Tax=Vannielia TaxID=2813041 RepID=UPI001C93CCFC|nr:DUF502 domain-containing protein [Vannielia litorea]MBY6047240.1 DUF502 domain-containing protein [Vannielia litorea]MBY6074654.1 DUF502 domain-containing protein [Vannielia litorea]MBY6152827.1 DUF502 domain-containing protein [Vannielia litorea]